ncbi:MAG TPA: DUF4149 domain-containing protein [Pseudomonas sp.]|nr:DUF4149 domain-containing protein [Pseudomonas sp.]
MSKSFTSNRLAAAAWQLAQTFWVGGLVVLHFLVLPALERVGLASLLVEDLSDRLKPLLVGIALGCALLQALLLMQVQGWGALWRDARGQLLLAVLGLAGLYFAFGHWLPQAAWWLQFVYLLLAFCGLWLVLQPLPDGRQAEMSEARRARH